MESKHKFKAGDRVYYSQQGSNRDPRVRLGTVHRVDYDGDLYMFDDEDMEAEVIIVEFSYGDFAVPEEIYNTPLYKALHEDSHD